MGTSGRSQTKKSGAKKSPKSAKSPRSTTRSAKRSTKRSATRSAILSSFKKPFPKIDLSKLLIPATPPYRSYQQFPATKQESLPDLEGPYTIQRGGAIVYADDIDLTKRPFKLDLDKIPGERRETYQNLTTFLSSAGSANQKGRDLAAAIPRLLQDSVVLTDVSGGRVSITGGTFQISFSTGPVTYTYHSTAGSGMYGATALFTAQKNMYEPPVKFAVKCIHTLTTYDQITNNFLEAIVPYTLRQIWNPGAGELAPVPTIIGIFSSTREDTPAHKNRIYIVMSPLQLSLQDAWKYLYKKAIDTATPVDRHTFVSYVWKSLYSISHILSFFYKECKFVHRDCKDDNLMIDSSGNIFLIDFGYSYMELARRPVGGVDQPPLILNLQPHLHPKPFTDMFMLHHNLLLYSMFRNADIRNYRPELSRFFSRHSYTPDKGVPGDWKSIYTYLSNQSEHDPDFNERFTAKSVYKYIDNLIQQTPDIRPNIPHDRIPLRL